MNKRKTFSAGLHWVSAWVVLSSSYSAHALCPATYPAETRYGPGDWAVVANGAGQVAYSSGLSSYPPTYVSPQEALQFTFNNMMSIAGIGQYGCTFDGLAFDYATMQGTATGTCPIRVSESTWVDEPSTFSTTISSGPYAPPQTNQGVNLSTGAQVTLDSTGNCGNKEANQGPPDDFCGVGDPINHGFGNNYQHELGYVGAGRFPLRLERLYSSSDEDPSDTYDRWRNYYERQLFPVSDASNAVSAVFVKRMDGRKFKFIYQNNKWTPQLDTEIQLAQTFNEANQATGWLVLTEDNTTESYDLSGGLVSITSIDGIKNQVEHDSQMRLRRVVDAYGRELIFSYSIDNGLWPMVITLPDSQVITFNRSSPDGIATYDTVTYPGGAVKTYIYDELNLGVYGIRNLMTGVIDENNNRIATWSYDQYQRAKSYSEPNGASSVNIVYNGNGTRTVTDALSTQRVFSFDTVKGILHLTGISQPGGSGCSAAANAQTYDANGNIASRTDFNGHVTTYAYDLSRNLETQRVEASGTPAARTISTQWHSYWRLPVKLAVPNKLTTYVYNGDTYNGSVVSCAPAGATVPNLTGGTQPIGVLCQQIEQGTTDVSGSQGLSATVSGTARISKWTYDLYGNALTADGPRTDVNDVTTYTYYTATDSNLGRRGNLASVTNALGQVTQITSYDANGRPLSITDPNGAITTLTYDLRGRLTSKNVAGETTSYQYDGLGQLTQVTLPDSSSLSYSYDAAHRLTDITDSQGNTVHYTLDALGNHTREDTKDPTGALVRTQQSVFDALNRLWKSIGAQGQTTVYAYDAKGNLTSRTDPLSHTTTNQYDALDRLIKAIDPNLGQTQYGYDGQDHLTQVIDPRNLTTNYSVDGLGNSTQQVSPDTGTTQRSFDAAGNVISRTDAKGQVTQYQYDALNRLTRITYQDSSQDIYTWDQGTNGQGHLTEIDQKNPAGTLVLTIQYSYDAHGRRLSEVRQVAGQTYTTQYQYDSGGRLNQLTYPSGRIVNYTYDSVGHISSVTLTDTTGTATVIASNIQYYPFGRLKSFLNGAGQTLSFGQDQDGRVSSYTLGNQLWQVGYDDASRVSSQVNTTNLTQAASYAYDANDRLTQATLPSVTNGYTYDANGNRTSQVSGSSTRSYSVSATNNQVSSISGSQPKTYTHDANGSITSDGSQGYSYDTRGRMTSSTGALGTTTYQIDPLGQRIRKTNSAEDSVYQYDMAGHLLSVLGTDGKPKSDTLWLGDIPIAVVQ